MGIIGARQTGKSTLLRDFIVPRFPQARYATMDSRTERSRADSAPEGFVKLEGPKSMLAIDEIQKAPDLFDAIKLSVDANRRPGMYLASGSTEFSRLTGIRESLTGRIGIVRLYPMTFAETLEKPSGKFYARPEAKAGTAQITLKEFDRKISNGGMPGMCFLRSDAEFQSSCAVWLETTCYRDLTQIQGRPLDGGLAMAILSEIARQPEPTAAHLARALKKDARVIQRHLDALAVILVVHVLHPHPAGVGKTEYAILDSGLATYLGAAKDNALRSHVIVEALAHLEALGVPHPALRYYRNAKTSRIPIVLDWFGAKGAPPSLAIAFTDAEATTRGDLESLAFFKKRAGETRLLLLTQTANPYRETVRGETVFVRSLRE